MNDPRLAAVGIGKVIAIIEDAYRRKNVLEEHRNEIAAVLRDDAFTWATLLLKFHSSDCGEDELA